MKKYIIAIACLFLMPDVFLSCRKEEEAVPPTVETASVDNIYNTSARIGGNVTNDGGSDITERGIYWDTVTNPEETGTKILIGTGTGIFYDTLKGLTSGTKYFVKAYAKNIAGLSYGTETFFTTQISFPTVTTSEISELTLTSASVGGNVTDDGGFEVTDRGIFWGTHPNPQLTGIKVEIGKGKGQFSHTLNGLNQSVVYYVVSFATNIKGTSYGDEISFRTNPGLPSVSTIVASEITPHSAKVGGEIVYDGGAAITEKGIWWGTSSNPENSGNKISIDSDSALFSNVIINLDPGVTYYFKAYAINNVGTAYGNEESFTTLGKLPEAITLGPTNYTATSITLNGLINANELGTSVTFEYGTTASYGSFEEIDSLVTGSSDTLSVEITGLTPMTVYHCRVVAVNELGTTYGSDSVFTTEITGIDSTVTDIEGNTYNTIGIGYQYWMTENLRTTKYNNGASIPLVAKDSLWNLQSGAAYCWYGNDSVNYSVPYGALYNWFTIETGNLCPTGWHVPANEDFSELISFLGDASLAGAKLKDVLPGYWKGTNEEATDQYDFHARAGGKRLDNGTYDYIGVEGNWWTSSDYSTLTASYLLLLYNYSNVFQAYNIKKYGMSVRCVKD